MRKVRSLPHDRTVARPKDKPLLLKVLKSKLVKSSKTATDNFVFLSSETNTWTVGTILSSATDAEVRELTASWTSSQREEITEPLVLAFVEPSGVELSKTISSRAELDNASSEKKLFYLNCTWDELKSLAIPPKPSHCHL